MVDINDIKEHRLKDFEKEMMDFLSGSTIDRNSFRVMFINGSETIIYNTYNSDVALPFRFLQMIGDNSTYSERYREIIKSFACE